MQGGGFGAGETFGQGGAAPLLLDDPTHTAPGAAAPLLGDRRQKLASTAAPAKFGTHEHRLQQAGLEAGQAVGQLVDDGEADEAPVETGTEQEDARIAEQLLRPEPIGTRWRAAPPLLNVFCQETGEIV